MEYRKIGNTDILVSRIAMGCWAIGGPSFENRTIASGWSKVDEPEAIRALNYAYDNGINHFDSADVYGNGLSEKLIGRAFGKSCKDIVVSSKVGFIHSTGKHRYSSENIRHQCELSLKNLGTDRISIYYLHHSNFGLNNEYRDEAIDTMNSLKKEGKIGAIGFSAYSLKEFCEHIPYIMPDVVQGTASMVDYHLITKGSRLLDLCREQSISFVGYQPLYSGILTGKYCNRPLPKFELGDHRGSSPKFIGKKLEKVCNSLGLLESIYGSTLDNKVSVALRFLLAFDSVDSIIPGARSVNQVKSIIKILDDKSFNGNDLKTIFKSFNL